jgi:hypothetical protein
MSIGAEAIEALTHGETHCARQIQFIHFPTGPATVLLSQSATLN